MRSPSHNGIWEEVLFTGVHSVPLNQGLDWPFSDDGEMV